MDNRDLLKALGGIGEEYIREAEPQETTPASKRLHFLRPAVLGSAAAACLLLGIAAWQSGLFTRRENPGPRDPAAAVLSGEETGLSETTADPSEKETDPPASETLQASEAPESESGEPGADVLYQKDGVTVRPFSGVSDPNAPTAQACLAYLTEEELFGGSFTMRARLTDIQPVEIINDRFEPPLDRSIGAVLTFEPISVLRGDLPDNAPVRVYAPFYLNTSLESLNYSLRHMDKGREGIIMLYKMNSTGYPEYMTALADYAPGDNQRFAIWEMPGGGLAFDQSAFPGVDKNWTLDQAEAYARDIIENKAPRDFSVQFMFRYSGEAENEAVSLYYDSRNGYYSEAGTAWMEEEYGAENLVTHLDADAETLGKIYRSCLRLKDLPEIITGGGSADGPNTVTIEISWTADGEQHRTSYSGSWYRDHLPDALKLEQTRTELLHYLQDCEARRKWEAGLTPIAAARRTVRAEAAKTALEAAFAEQYGPGGAPSWFRRAVITEGGYLEVWLAPCSKANMEEIRNLIPDGLLLFREESGSR